MFKTLKDQFLLLIVSCMSRKLSLRISCMYCRSIFASVKIKKKKKWTLEILILWFISVQIKRSKKTKLQWVMVISLWFYVTSEWLLLTINGKCQNQMKVFNDFRICTFDFFVCNYWLQRQISAIAWIFNCFHPSTSNILLWPFYKRN